MAVLDASRRNHPVPRLALWSLGADIVATIGANLAHGLCHGPVGALISAWPALTVPLSSADPQIQTLLRGGADRGLTARMEECSAPPCTRP